MEVQTYNQYKSGKDIFNLIATAFLEPFIFHPFVVWSALQGHIDYFKKKNSWGEMTRQGLTPQKQLQVNNATSVVETKEPRLVEGIRESISYSIIFMAAMLVVKVVELIRDALHFGIPKDFFAVIKYGLINDLSFDANIAIIPIALFIGLFLLSKKAARIFFISFSLLLIIIHAALAEYFLQTLVPLGADLFGYSIADIKQTVGAAGIPVAFILIAILLLVGAIVMFIKMPKKLRLKPVHYFAVFAVFILSAFGSVVTVTSKWKPGPEFSNTMALNKSFFFYKNCYQSFFESKPMIANLIASSAVDRNDFQYVNEKQYPFLHTVDSTDVLSPFFSQQTNKPNIVFLVVEGLGRAFSNQDAYLGSFTPFIDSLSNHSLYWSNFLSEGGRTFAMLPSIYASLPFGKNGFLELGDKMPAHNSLFTILKENGYTCNFFYGGDAAFDNMNQFVKMDGGNVYDEKTFSDKYVKMPKNESGFTWGYGDDQVLAKLTEVNGSEQTPTMNAVMTLSTHNPFLVNEQAKYLDLFEQRMQQLQFTEAQKEEHRRYKNQYATILYMDNSIRDFINNYRNQPGFNNTIFIITGDHRMPEIPMSTEIDRYHVPLIIYSPMLKRTQKFKAVNTHFDITPSLLSFLHHQI